MLALLACLFGAQILATAALSKLDPLAILLPVPAVIFAATLLDNDDITCLAAFTAATIAIFAIVLLGDNHE